VSTRRPPDLTGLTVGTLTLHPRGFGFVIPEDGGGLADVFVAAPNLLEAMHGDRVAVRVEGRSAKGVEGRIVHILERRHALVVGRYETGGDGVGSVVPFDPRVLNEIHVPRGKAVTALPGDMVVVSMTRWPSVARGPAGHVVEVLGQVTAPGVDTEVVIRHHGISDAHAPEAVAQARALGASIRQRDLTGREDFRSLITVTIDGEHARDFDDAITLERRPGGRYWLGVHIADVSHYVEEGSALDRDAYGRGTSVYFPERAVHMFPPELATGLCSLNPHVDRLVQSCFMEVDNRGRVLRHEIHDGVIRSDARMTYTEVNAILTDRDPVAATQYASFVPMLEHMRELFEVLLSRRRRRGSIDFDLPETEVVLSELGEIEAIVPSERNIAHRLIEEFMLLANETVASDLVARNMPALHRVHEAPDAGKVDDFEMFVSTLGYSLAVPSTGVTPRHFQALVTRIHDQPEERPIAALMLRTMQKARYEASSLGHFGLAAETYTHFTSPIRRYPDLLVHRRLREARGGSLNAARRAVLEAGLEEIARHTSELERRANEAERELIQWKKVRFMADRVGEEYEGFISGVAPFGLFVGLVEPFVEGLVPISSMADDYYRFVEQQHILRGESTKKVYRLGDRVLVQVVRVDANRRQVDFALVEIAEALREAPSGVRGSKPRVTSKRERLAAKRPGKRKRQARRQR
jgi:ribonuclease R